jgi:hypothetical protein
MVVFHFGFSLGVGEAAAHVGHFWDSNGKVGPKD